METDLTKFEIISKSLRHPLLSCIQVNRLKNIC